VNVDNEVVAGIQNVPADLSKVVCGSPMGKCVHRGKMRIAPEELGILCLEKIVNLALRKSTTQRTDERRGKDNVADGT
jgi:hypothetical protein